MTKSATKKKNIENKKPSANAVDIKKEGKKLFPWELLADCILIIFFLITNEWGMKYEGQLLFAFGTAIILAISLLNKNNRALLFGKITPVFLFLLAQCILYFVGLFYGWYPKFALQQFFLNIGGLFVFSTAYVCFLRDEKNLSWFALFASASIALVSLISIELATSRHLLGLFESIAKITGSTIPLNFSVFETNTRVITVLGNPNVYAPIAVFGMFLSLWGCGKPGDRSKINFVFMGLATICAAIFVLCFSMGTILVYFAALFGVLVLTNRGNRASFIAKNAVCIVFAMIEAFAVFSLLDKGILPVLSVILLSAVFAFLYTYIRPIKLPAMKNKKLPILAAVVLVIVFSLCAYLLQGPYSLDKSDSFRRAVALNEGSYGLDIAFENAQPDSNITVDITSMSYEQAALKENTLLKRAVVQTGEIIDFDVPDSSAAVFFNIRANAPLKITNATINGNDVSEELALRYTIIPEFVVNRLQGLWVNDNAIQRFIFFRDGIRLGMDSPVIGQGGGAFEGGLYGAAEYHYVTRHPHNEYIQRFIDGGIVGLLLFIALTVFSFKAVFMLRKKDENTGLYPLLLGCMLVVFLHALLEVDFMMPAYRLMTSILFALVAARCGDIVKLPKGLKPAIATALILVGIATVGLSVGRFRALDMVSSGSSLKSLQTAITLDPFNSEDYKLSYLISTMDNTESSLVSSRQNKYLKSLGNKRVSTDALYYMSQFHLLKAEPDIDKGLENAEAYIRNKRVDKDSWDNVFALYFSALDRFRADAESSAKITASITSLCTYLQELGSTLPKAIEPTLALPLYLLAEQPESGGVLADSRKMYDLNMDGASDLVSSISGGMMNWELTLLLPSSELYVVRVYQDGAAACRVMQNGSEMSSEYNPETGCFETFLFHTSSMPVTYTISTEYSEDVYFVVERLM